MKRLKPTRELRQWTFVDNMRCDIVCLLHVTGTEWVFSYAPYMQRSSTNTVTSTISVEYRERGVYDISVGSRLSFYILTTDDRPTSYVRTFKMAIISVTNHPATILYPRTLYRPISLLTQNDRKLETYSEGTVASRPTVWRDRMCYEQINDWLFDWIRWPLWRNLDEKITREDIHFEWSQSKAFLLNIEIYISQGSV